MKDRQNIMHIWSGEIRLNITRRIPEQDQRKDTNSKNSYNDSIPFTKMSAGVLHTYHKQFGNVYQKGALINMCLDIKLLQLSNGKYGIMNLIHDLSNKYGKQKGFKDDELFNEIGKLTYPEIKQFLEYLCRR